MPSGKKRKRHKRIYAIILEYKDAPCKDCGIKYPPYVMDFDHLVPKTKLTGLAYTHRFNGRKDVEEEISKLKKAKENL